MQPPEEVRRRLVQLWIEKADQDLAAAEILLKESRDLRPIVAFHAQQAVEKYLKAILVRHQIYFARTHDMGKLLDLIAGCEPATAILMQDATLLTPFGVEVRYPGDSPELLPGEETRAIEINSKPTTPSMIC
jgi:HEPN domain-containing protein